VVRGKQPLEAEPLGPHDLTKVLPARLLRLVLLYFDPTSSVPLILELIQSGDLTCDTGNLVAEHNRYEKTKEDRHEN
jgi:hypothetical protein